MHNIFIFNELRLCIYVILNMAPEGLALMGPDCASWGIPARGTAMRNYMNVFGAVHLDFVSRGNLTISRIP